MKHMIRFRVTQEDGWYTASGVDLAVVTQARTLDELTKNIKEATTLHMEGETELHQEYYKDAPVLLDVELPSFSHA